MRLDTFKKWGIKANPFDAHPPADERKRAQLFTGREDELDLVLSHMGQERAFLVYGLYGVGKTMLMKEAQRRQKLHSKHLLTPYELYVTQVPFIQVVLKGIAEELAKAKVEEAAETLRLLTEGSESASVERETGFGAQLGIDSTHVKAGTDGKRMKTISKEGVLDPYAKTKQLISLAAKKDLSLFIVVDEVDRHADLAQVHEIVGDAKILKEGYGASIMLAGHPTNVTRRLLTDGGGTFIEIPLHQMQADELIQVMIRYLNSVRDKRLDDPAPFRLEAASWVAQFLASNQDFTPRLFVLACQYLLDMAAKDGLEWIELEPVRNYWPYVQVKLMQSIENWDRTYHIIRIIYKRRGIREDADLDTLVEILGGRYGDFEAVMAEVRPLVEAGILVAGDDGVRRQVTLSPILEDQYLQKLFATEETPDERTMRDIFGPDLDHYVSVIRSPEQLM